MANYRVTPTFNTGTRLFPVIVSGDNINVTDAGVLQVISSGKITKQFGVGSWFTYDEVVRY